MWKLINFRKIFDSRGNLTPIEGEEDISFRIARVYYLYDIPSGSVRAGHAHTQLQQIYIPVSGSFDVELTDGTNTDVLQLNRPDQGLYIGPGVWRIIKNFSAGSVCLVLASAKYDEEEYIRDKDNFDLFVQKHLQKSQ
ncbi:sugar 3,4-ketoisomerase [Methylobacterium brachythecii]|uniref:dTDP-6-deoxy-3,4-keto-hexulose isomerase n=1 Tax=Methylobacterium brachythecii TaxID=1176177 RepID=A0ABQ6D950_9HYPH|nr:FdtA/QdtA family cupin domain-containing protein [Methylobacterium brachythecii]GLS46546.1 dTDP-6-deoxy-3,4-keto-hexulose isomerase [Methylobacterium brachythecii]